MIGTINNSHQKLNKRRMTDAMHSKNIPYHPFAFVFGGGVYMLENEAPTCALLIIYTHT